MKICRYIIILISFVWIAEDLAFISQTAEIASVALEIDYSERLEKQNESNMQEYLSPTRNVSVVLKLNNLAESYTSPFYRAPTLVVPDVPPDYFS